MSDEGKYNFRLTKNEILRGFNAYFEVLSNSKVVSSEFLKAYVSRDIKVADSKEFSKSPLFRFPLKVGFIIAKKKISKSVFRNRLKRLLKESYRLRKNTITHNCMNAKLIFTLNEKGYGYVKQNPGVKLDFFFTEMDSLISSLNKIFK